MRPASQRNGQGVSWTLKSHSWARVDQGAAGSGGGRESGGPPAATIDAAAKAERVYSRQSLARHLNKKAKRGSNAQHEDLRNRIRSVRSTQQITAAMKVVAASRLRRAQEAVEAARPYTYRMERVLASLASGMAGRPEALPLLAGTREDHVHWLRAGADSDQAPKLVGMVGKERDQQGREQRHPGATTPVPGIPFERS